MADYYLHKTAAHIDELLEKVEGLNNYDDTEVRGLINNKVDKETGKGLSTNDFTDAYKTELDGLDTALDAKVDKETGKGLSTNDYTTSEKTKLNGIESGANVNVQADWNQSDSTADDYIKNKPTIPDAQIQSDWEQTNTESKDFIKNKPVIPPAQVNVDWNAESGVAQILNKPTLGSAAFKNYTSSVTSDSNDLVMSGAVYSAISTKADLENGKVPASQLPSYVDDVVEYASISAFPATGESGKIYVATDTNKTYRWSRSGYTEISESLALGETASTAYAGNKGKANADAIAAIKDGTNIDSFADVETALSAKLNTADVDTALSDTSTNPVQNKVLTGQIGGLVDRGAKNHINYTLTTIKNINTSGTWNGNIYSINNVTYTVNDDMTITASGTATGYASLILKRFDPQELIGYAGYILLGCPTGGSDETYRLEIQRAGSPWTRYVINYGEGVQIPDVGDSFAYQAQCFLTVSNGATVSNLTFKPMICSMEDYEASPEFVPYAPTNRELYEMILALQNAQNGG